MSTTRALDQLQQVQELNRVFLGLLQARVRGQRGELRAAARRRAGGRRLRRARCSTESPAFPRALFHVELGVAAAAGARATPTSTKPSTIFASRFCSRPGTRAGRARIRRGCCSVSKPPMSSGCRSALLPDLQRLACTPGVLQCAFRERHWFWHGLFTATRPELRRQLTLMALQPGVALGWPQRRPPQPTA